MEEVVKKILVAEDNQPLASILKYTLSRAGFAVTVACDGQTASDIARQETFDLIITDYQMPGKNGEELCKSIREDSACSDVPLVLCSAKQLEIDLPRLSGDYGVVRVFRKPFSPREIVAFVRELLNSETTCP